MVPDTQKRSRLIHRNCLAAIIAIFLLSWTSQAADYPFGYSQSITIDHTKVGVSGTSNKTLSNFPFLFNTTDTNLRTTANGGHVTNANGYDIVFRGLDSNTCGSRRLIPAL